jgi:hypothetical protein
LNIFGFGGLLVVVVVCIRGHQVDIFPNETNKSLNGGKANYQ